MGGYILLLEEWEYRKKNHSFITCSPHVSMLTELRPILAPNLFSHMYPSSCFANDFPVKRIIIRILQCALVDPSDKRVFVEYMSRIASCTYHHVMFRLKKVLGADATSVL
jgi:hypothetical protein